MSIEEIIIDGVNVKDCKRRIGKNSYCRYFKRPCADNNFNCIWKKHERLKEENVKLLFDKGTLVEFCNKLTQIIDKKKESENKLLQTLQEIKAIAKTGMHCEGMGCDFMPKILDLITKAEEEWNI